VELTEAGVVHYAVYHATVQVVAVADVVGVIHSSLDPSTAQVLRITAEDYIGGLAGAGSIAVPRANERVVTSITPPCVGGVCAYTAYGLPADTAFRCVTPLLPASSTHSSLVMPTQSGAMNIDITASTIFVHVMCEVGCAVSDGVFR
jgi:hypothetical protein